jgi:DNA-binding NarL/FixJ family response regulator
MRTILLVDDHGGFRSQARMLLEAEGCSVVGEAPDGRTAIATSRSLRPDLVLLDIGLPDMDGFDVARSLTCSDSPPLVILISSRDAAAYGPRIAACGAVGFLSKDELSGAAIDALVGTR